MADLMTAQPGTEMESPEGDSMPAEGQRSGVCVEIYAYDDGSFEVSSGPIEAESDGDEMGEEKQPAGSVGEALKIALGLLKGSAGGGAEADMAAGFNSVRGSAK